jgi:predicted metal-dependent hydrolase
LLTLRRIGTVSAASVAEAERQAIALDLGAPVSIRVNPRARRLLLRIDAASRQVELVLPKGVPAEHGLKFLAAQRGWIAARLLALPMPVPFAEGAIVPVFGVPHRICRTSDPAAPPVAILGGEIRVRGDPAHLARRVRDHLVRLAREDLTRRARLCAARIGRSVTRVGVRDTKSRWGSCSAKGALSFSWRLVLMPEAVVDYVVAHEVAHLAEMNHGPRFWRLVQSLTPDCAMPRAWLKRHRGRLFSYG